MFVKAGQELRRDALAPLATGGIRFTDHSFTGATFRLRHRRAVDLTFAFIRHFDAGAIRSTSIPVCLAIGATDRRVHHVTDTLVGSRVAMTHAIGSAHVGAAIRVVVDTFVVNGTRKAGEAAAYAHSAVVTTTFFLNSRADAIHTDLAGRAGSIGITRHAFDRDTLSAGAGLTVRVHCRGADAGIPVATVGVGVAGIAFTRIDGLAATVYTVPFSDVTSGGITRIFAINRVAVFGCLALDLRSNTADHVFSAAERTIGVAIHPFSAFRT